MLQKLKALLVVLSALVSRVHTGLYAGALFIATYGPTAAKVLSGTPGASLVPDVTSLVTFCGGLVLLLKQAPPDSSMGKAVDAALSKTNSAAQAGFSALRAAVLCMLFGAVGTGVMAYAKRTHRPKAPVPTETAALQGCNTPVNTANVLPDLQPAGACILAALASGQINFSDPKTAVLQVLKICTGATAEAIVATITDLFATGDAGVGSAASDVLAKVPAAQLLALRDAAKAMAAGQ